MCYADNNTRQIEIHTAKPVVPSLSCPDVKTAIARLKKYKSLGNNQIRAELIQSGGKILVSVIHKLINSIWNKEELPDQWKESIIINMDVGEIGLGSINWTGLAQDRD
jgi:hypothetical protein